MRMLLKNAKIYTGGYFSRSDICIENGRITALEKGLISDSGDIVFDFNNCFIFPGLADVHVHLREPGFSYKETIKTGTAAAAAGGYTDVCTMPNLNPAPDSLENLAEQQRIIDRDAKIRVHPYACITKGGTGRGEPVDFESLLHGCIGFSDDGKGVQADGRMEAAMRRVAALGGIIAAHCEDERLLKGGYIHAGKYAAEHRHRGICSESEWGQIKRDIALVEKTGCNYHVCHVSTKESVELIRRAKERGLPVSCETAPHYLVLCEDDMTEDGRMKMNPPLRTADDRAALIGGIKDGTIDMIATDHAPHSEEEKSKGLKDSAMGVVGIETALPILYTELVCKNIISMEKLIDIMSTTPRKRFKIRNNEITVGALADFCVFDCNEFDYVNSAEFVSMGRATPFEGRRVEGRVRMTVCAGNIVYGGEN